MDIVLRELELKDLEAYQYWNHPSREFHKYNGPYYGKKDERELKDYVEELRSFLKKGAKDVLQNKKIIAEKETDELIGEVNWYWKSEETLWMEVGVVLFNENYWGKGIGFAAMTMWIDELFARRPELVRIGLSTWSGNIRMMKLAEKLGLKKEAVYRNARIVEGQYYDSVSFGILKEEWQALRGQSAKCPAREPTAESFAIPGVGGIVIKEFSGEPHILMQVRWKEDAPSESGLLEIPAGKIRAFESLFDALKREIREETGLTVTEILGEDASPIYEANEYRVVNFTPFSCAQNLTGKYPIMVFVFLCHVEGELLPYSDEAKNYQWISISKLKAMLRDPAQLYPMHVDTLHKYLMSIENAI